MSAPILHKTKPTKKYKTSLEQSSLLATVTFWLRTATAVPSAAAVGVLRQSGVGEKSKKMEKQIKEQKKQKKNKKVVYTVQPFEKMGPSVVVAYEEGTLWPPVVYLNEEDAERDARLYNEIFEDDEPAIVREVELIG